MLLFFFLIEPAVTIALKFRVGYLLPELAAHTLIVFDALYTARTVAVLLRQSLAQSLHDLAVLIINDLHFRFSVSVRPYYASFESIKLVISDFV